MPTNPSLIKDGVGKSRPHGAAILHGTLTERDFIPELGANSSFIVFAVYFWPRMILQCFQYS